MARRGSGNDTDDGTDAVHIPEGHVPEGSSDVSDGDGVADAPRPDRAASRLRGLSGFRDAAEDDVALAARSAPVRSEGGHMRIVLEDLDDAIEELPELSGEARALRRLLEISKRLARVADEDRWAEATLDAALVLLAADATCLVTTEGEPGPAVAMSRDTAGDAPLGDRVPLSAAEIARALGPERAIVFAATSGRAACVAASLPGSADLLVAMFGRASGVPDDTSRDLLRALADQAALARERARLRTLLVKRDAELAEAGARAERLNRRLADLLQRRTLELRETRAELARVDAAEGFSTRFSGIVGRGPAMLEVLRQVDRVGPTTVPVLFEGESGTGKELLARALHESSDRAALPFVAENCAALPDSLLENELFGHERGAFTGADTAAMGLFERADGGTLFLDEVGDMSPSLQKRLLRVLQEGEVRRVGGASVTTVDVRVVTATNRVLLDMVRDGSFREDLYYRLAVVKVRVPPLRERREDIPALVAHFLRRSSDSGLPLQITDDALESILRHDWPGNIRELENEVRRAAALSRGPIDVDVLSDEVVRSLPGVPELVRNPLEHLEGRDLRSLVAEVETRAVRAVLAQQQGNITRTARELGLSRLGLRKKMQRYGLAREGGDETRVRPSQVRN